MIDREAVLSLIDGAYAARIRGDKSVLATKCTPSARFELAGEKGLLVGFAAGPAGFSEAVDQLIDLVEFRSVERLAAVVEGSLAAVQWRATVSVAGRAAIETELFDLWEVTPEGKIASLVQFADTGLIAKELASARAGV